MPSSNNNSSAMDRYICENMHAIFCEHIIYSITDTNGIIINVSNAFCNETGYKREEVVGKTHSFLRAPDFPNSVYDELWETIVEDKPWRGQIKNIKKNGEHYWASSVIEPIFKNKSKVGYISVRKDITKEKRHEELLEDLTMILDA